MVVELASDFSTHAWKENATFHKDWVPLKQAPTLRHFDTWMGGNCHLSQGLGTFETGSDTPTL